MQSRRAAFTLIELSIVLVILGLLVGGVFAGQSLIKAGELRSIGADYTKYATAIYAFREKYNGMPGDLKNATAFWGVAAGDGSGTDAPCYAAASTDRKTCNGNGNGKLYLEDNSPGSNAPEWYRAWQHLSNAGLIDGHYTGKADPTLDAGGWNRGARPGLNVPQGKITGTGYTLMSLPASFASWVWWDGDYDGMAFGTAFSGAGIESRGPALTAGEAYQVDSKMDDGNPAIGLVRSYKVDACNVSTTPSLAAYAINLPDVNCALFIALKPPEEENN